MRRSFGPRALVATAAIGAAIVLAGCSGSSNSSQSTTTSPLPAPGHGSPQAAVAGFSAGTKAHDLSVACQYVVPMSQSQCVKQTSLSATGSLSLGHTTIQGDQAIVTLVTAHYCVQGSCHSNSNAMAGQPTGSTSFNEAFQKAASTGGAGQPCQRVNGLWYVGTQ